MTQLAQQLPLDQIRRMAKEDFYFFAKGVLRFDWLVPHVHGPVCAVLQDQTIKRKLIELPRGWLKSTIGSIAYPIWCAVNNPEIRILLVQNSATNAQKKLEVIAGQWENNELLRALFPELLPDKNCTWKKDALELKRRSSWAEATFEAAGTSTRVVSRHYDKIIQDDTVAPEYDELGNEALPPTADEVEKAIGWHRTNCLPLLNNPLKDELVIIGTRWYEMDLIDWVKKNQPEYYIISRAVKEDEEGRPDPRGTLVYPERFDESVLNELETVLGPYMFNCLYYNQPVRTEDMLFQPDWFRYYENTPHPRNLTVYTTVDVASDPALARSKDIDYNVVMTCAKDSRTGYIYVLDYFRERCNPGKLAATVFDHVKRYNPVVVGYDDVAYQRSIEYWLKEMMRQEGVYFLMEPIKRTGKDAKERAISSLQPVFASGSVFFREWMKELQAELLKFPLGAHDDLADALAMQLQLWRQTRGPEFYGKTLESDPLSVDYALAEIKKRHTRRDLLTISPSQLIGHQGVLN